MYVFRYLCMYVCICMYACRMSVAMCGCMYTYISCLWLNWLESAFGEWKHERHLGQKFEYDTSTDAILLGKELTCNCLSLWIVSVKTSTASVSILMVLELHCSKCIVTIGNRVTL